MYKCIRDYFPGRSNAPRLWSKRGKDAAFKESWQGLLRRKEAPDFFIDLKMLRVIQSAVALLLFRRSDDGKEIFIYFWKCGEMV